MGTRIVHEIVTGDDDDRTVVCILYSNVHNDAERPKDVFTELAASAIGPNDLLKKLVVLTYGEGAGNIDAGRPMFSLVEAPYGDFELIQTADFSHADSPEDPRCVVTERLEREETVQADPQPTPSPTRSAAPRP